MNNLTKIIMLLILVSFISMPVLGAEKPIIWSDENSYRQMDKLIVAADKRLFTVMCIFNSVYDYDLEHGEAYHPVREKVRLELDKRLGRVSEDKVASWKDFYKKQQGHIWNYINLAMSLSADYPFEKVLVEEVSWWTNFYRFITGFNGFTTIMNEFWIEMELESLWNQVYPEYLVEIDKFDFERIAQEEAYIWEYIKQEKTDIDRFLVSIPNLMDSHYMAFGFQYENYYYTVSSPGSHNYGLNIHEYLHGIVGPLIDATYKDHADQLKSYFESGRKEATIKNNYNDFAGFVEENLVRALDTRIRVVYNMYTERTALDRIRKLQTEGFTLLPIFYQSLQDFEKMDIALEDYVSRILSQVE